MVIYIFLFLLIVSCIVRHDIGNKSQSGTKGSFIFCCIVLSLVAGIRYHIGSDTANYIAYFEAVPMLPDFFNSIDLQALTQPLWFLLMSAMKTIYNDFLILQLIHSFAVNLLIGRFIYRTCRKPFIALLVYYCCCWWNFSFEIMRESICVAIYLNILYEYVKDCNIKKFILFSFPLLFVHMFAFIPIALTILSHYFKYKNILYYGTLVTILLFILLDVDFILRMLSYSRVFINESLAERVTLYVMGDKYGFKTVSILGYVFIIITNVVYPYIVSKSKFVDDKFAKILLLYVFVVILRMKLLIFIRICNYWDVVLIVFAINYICANKKTLKTYYVAVCLMYATFTGVHTFLQPQSFDISKYDSRYIPYASYLDKSINPIREALYY